MRVVLKIGGSLKEQSLATLVAAVREASALGHTVAIVHGGGPNISAALTAAGMELPFVDGLRQTSPEAMPIVERALMACNEHLCGALQDDVATASLTATAGVIRVHSQPDMRTGVIAEVVTVAMDTAVARHAVPVIAPIGVDAAGLRYNVNADTAASAIAAAWGASKLVFCTDVPGVYRNFVARDLLYDVSLADLASLLGDTALASGMIPKVQAMLTAGRAGVPLVYVVDGADADSVAWSLRDRASVGTARSHGGTRLVLAADELG